MKKFRLMIMSLLMLTLGGMLVACTTRSPNVEFSSKEEIMSVGQQIDLSEYLKVSGKVEDIDVNVENSSIAQVDGKILKAKSTGKTYVYATYKKNVLASLHIVVKDNFTAPTGFNVQEDRTLSGEGNVLTWNTVSAFYQNDPTPTIASQYLVKGTLRKVSETDGSVSEIEEINQIVDTNRFVPQQYGEYDVTVTALGKDYFDSSAESEIVSFYYGAMPQVLSGDLSWNTNGTLSWEAVEGASYRVLVDGMVLGERQSATAANLSSYFDETYSGEHEVGIVVYDNANKKLPTVSQTLNIIKIDFPTIEYIYDEEEGGKLAFKGPDFSTKLYAKLIYEDSSFVDKEYDWNDEEIFETFVGVPAGAFYVSVYATPKEGNFYKSDAMVSDTFYKLSTLSLVGTGENEENQMTWEFEASAHTVYQTKILTNLSGVKASFDGLNIDTVSKTIQLQLNAAGNYVLSAKQIPNAEQYIYRERPIFAINSDESNSITITKLEQIESITHAYEAGVSVFEFEPVENATKYELFVLNEDEYVAVPTADFNMTISDTVKVTFGGKVETMFDAYKDNGVLTFKIVAHTDNDLMTINSASQKILTELAAPQGISRHPTELDYKWTEVEFADQYNVEVYKIDKTTYDAGSTDIDVSALTNLGQTVDTNQFTFEEEGYYLVKVFSISGSENMYISSTTCLTELVCVAKALQVEDVKLGYNGEKYYLNIKNSANVDTFEISVDNSIFENLVSDQETSTYILTQNFDESVGEHEIKVTAHATDRTIYLDSDTYTLKVIKLPAVTKNNLQLDDWSIVANSEYVVTSKSQNLSLEVVENAKGVKIWETLNESNCAGGTTAQSAHYSLADKTNVSLSFMYYGSEKVGEYFNIENDTICLDSEVSEIVYERLSTLTELRYDSGSLKFTNLTTAATGGYNITIFCKDANGVVRNLILVIKGEVVSARYGDANVRLTNSIAAVSNLGTTVTVRLSALLELVKECSNTDISNVYNQAVEYGFAIYSTPTDMTTLIASQYGTLQLDASKNIVKVEKMSAPELEFSLTETNITFTWNEISTSSDVSSQTSYQMHLVSEEGDEAYGPALSGSTTQAYSLSDFDLGQYYTFYVVAQNPYYMNSNNSNKVRIYKLKPINSLKLISGGTYDGQLEYQVATEQSDFYDYVLIGSVQDTTGKIAITDQTSVSLKVVGKKNLASGDVVTSYLDSATTSWNLKNMSTLAPADQTVTFNNNVISWNEFATGKGLASQKYVLMFDDGENVATFTTTQTSVSFTEGTEIYDTVAALNEGSLTITVYAFLDTYSVVAGGDIYFAAASNLANGHREANFYQYSSTATINKLTTPVVSSVVFDYQNDLSKASEPDIVVNFTGNYDPTGKFAIYLNDKHLTTSNITKLDDVYTYRMLYADYNNEIAFGATANIKIYALSETDIPSSMGSVAISRAAKIVGATFEADGRRYKQNLVISFNADHTDLTSGGVVAKFTYIENGGTEAEEYVSIPVGSSAETIEYAMKDFITAHLSAGGKIKAELLTNSYSNDANKIYYLACGEYFESEEFNVLNKVTASDITKTAGGFEIDPTINSNKTTYIVKYGANEYTVKYKDDKFEFEFDKTWTDNNYNLIVYALENGYIESVRETIPVTLSRINAITSVSMSRNSADLSEVTLSWDEVSGAAGYIFRMYDGEGTEIFKDTLTGHSYTLTELFGASYTKVFAYGEISSIISDLDVRIGISTIGSSASQNNSQEYSFNATIKGNSMVVSDFGINERGVITVDVNAGEKYLYRFVDGTSGAISNSVWTLVEADSDQLQIDASFLSENDTVPMGTKFNIEFLRVGNITATSTDTNFVLDSSYFTSANKTFTYEMGIKLKSVSIDVTDSNIVLGITNGAYTKIYVGLSADAILSEDKVAEVEVEMIGEGSEDFAISVSNLLDILVNELNIGDYEVKTLYFWDYRETEDSESTYVNYKPLTLEFKYVQDCGFDQVKKFDDNEGTDFKVDLADVAVFFNKVSDDYVSGNLMTFFFVKVSQDGEEKGTYTVSGRDLKSDYYPSSSAFIITLTKLFENEDLQVLSGNLTLDFAILQIDNSGHIRISNWLSNTANAIEFTRIQAMESLTLSGGNLSWKTSSELATNYYVYFIEELRHGKMGDNFVRYDTNQNFFLATDYIGQDGAFYIAVQAVSTETNCLPSNLIYITEERDQKKDPVKVTKNQIKSPLKLSGGKFYFDWDLTGDFLTAFDELSSTDSEGGAKFTTQTFHYPFTMTLSDLVGDRIKIRFRFKNSANVTKNFDFNAKDLLLNLFDIDAAYKTKVSALGNNAGTTASQRVYKSFAELMEKTGTNGVANSKRLFDDIFENLQEGRYSLEYCLVGGNTTLNSYWYEYENQNGENVIYVGSEPLISAIKEKTSTDAINDYKILIKKSVVYDSSYQAIGATNYVMKVYNDVGVAMIFAVSQSAVSLLDGEISETVSVYESNARGEVVSNGDYLMFYINHNSANSLLGKFGEVMTKGTYSMQIYTVGNDYTTSSKSEYFKLTFYSMGENLAITNGMFTWTTQANRNTTVVYKRHESLLEKVQVLDGSVGSLSFDLDGEGYGLYDYIEFVTVGDISKNVIAVDSEIYKLKDVYKLQNPILSNYKGMLTINETASNIEMLDVGFSESPLYTYKIYNNESTESLSTIITNNAKTPTYTYTPGATGYTSSDAEYDYRRTEVNANEFFVSSIGSTAKFGYEVAPGDEYYVRTVHGLDEDDQLSDKNILISSSYQSLMAKMMNTPTRLSITNGVLTWSGVTGSGDLELSRSSSVVYRVEVTQYKVSYTEGGQSKTTVNGTTYLYTTQTSFDFANLDETQLEKDVKYIDVSVRALGLVKAATKPTTIDEKDCVSLVEGGVAYGTLKYKDSSLYILIGEGGTLDTIERSQGIDENSAHVVNGHLQWTFSVEGEIDTSDGQWALLSHYKFSVMNARNVEINGQCIVSDTTEIVTKVINGEEVKFTRFTVTFLEDKDQIAPGSNIKLSICAIEIADGKNLIKSYAETINVKKLAAIDTSFVAIDSTADPKIELLNLNKYFTDYAGTYSNLQIKTLQYIGEEYELDGRVFDENKYKLYILTADASVPDPKDEHALEDVEIVDQETTLRLTFQAFSDAENCLYSDISEDIVLQRADWQDEIVWNENSEQFEWDYTGQYSLQTAVEANVVSEEEGEYVDVLDDEDNPVTESLLVGTLYNIVEEGEDFTIISVQKDDVTTTYRLPNTYIVSPTFTVTISYGTDTRTYITQTRYFKPTVIGQVTRFAVRVKLGETNIQSNEVVYNDGASVNFALFASGDGTLSNPYEIANKDQFSKLAYRMTKDSYLNEYTQNGAKRTEEAKYYFTITNNITLDSFAGVKFHGEFTGVLDGTNHVLSYTITDVGELDNKVTFAAGYLSSEVDEFNVGASLFSNISSSGIVKNLKLNANLNKESGYISQNTTFAGLAIVNNGQINNVSLVGFESNFVGNYSSKMVNMLYSGIVTVNIGGTATIINSSVQNYSYTNENSEVINHVVNMVVNNGTKSQRNCISGIASINYATIENCVIGETDKSTTFKVVGEDSTVETKIGGVAIVNVQNSLIKNCTNNALLTVEATDISNVDQWRAYFAGIVCHNQGSLQDNTNNNYVEHTEAELGFATIRQGEIFINP